VTDVEPIENDVTMFGVDSLLIMNGCNSLKGIAAVRADGRKDRKVCDTKRERV